jgi:flagellar basal-body rod protein FlgG
MHPALWISKTGLDAQQMDVRMISNNLANVSTIGYKKDRPIFEDLLYQNVLQAGSQYNQSTEVPSGLMLGTGVNPVATQKMFIQGNIINTENSLDLAINGRGFFQVLQVDGTLQYTRDGQFQINSTGNIVTANGLLLQPTITIPNDAQSLSIGVDGTVTVTLPGTTTTSTLGQLQLADFINPAGLQPMGNNLYGETMASGTPILNTPTTTGMGALMQGNLESSNVNVVEELVRLIETQRAYEMNAKSIETVDGMLQFVTQHL